MRFQKSHRLTSWVWGRRFRVVIVCGLLLFVTAEATSRSVRAATANEDAILLSTAFQEIGSVKFNFTAFDCIDIQTFVNGILKNTYDAGCQSAGSLGSALFVLDSEAGNWRTQLWSRNSNLELWGRNWTLPGLTLRSVVAPSSGNIGDGFAVTSTLGLANTGPDAYQSTGTLSVSDSASTITNSVTPLILSAHYFAYFGNPVSPDYATFKATSTFSYSAGGNRSVVASYTDTLGTIVGSPVGLTVSDQFADLHKRINDLQNQNAQLNRDWNSTAAQLSALSSALFLAQSLTAVLAVVAITLAMAAWRKGRISSTTPRSDTTYAPPEEPPPR